MSIFPGLLISGVCKDEMSAIQLALGSVYPNMLISGKLRPPCMRCILMYEPPSQETNAHMYTSFHTWVISIWYCFYYCSCTGIIWPIESMPVWLKYLAYCLPMTFGAEAMRCIQARGQYYTSDQRSVLYIRLEVCAIHQVRGQCYTSDQRPVLYIRLEVNAIHQVRGQCYTSDQRSVLYIQLELGQCYTSGQRSVLYIRSEVSAIHQARGQC